MTIILQVDPILNFTTNNAKVLLNMQIMHNSFLRMFYKFQVVFNYIKLLIVIMHVNKQTSSDIIYIEISISQM